MPTIRKRGATWQVQVRRSGYPALSRSFLTRSDALAWAREKERSIDRAELPLDVKQLKRTTVADLLVRYVTEITPTKRGAVSERSRIRTMLKHKLARISLNNLSGAIVAQYRDDRLTVVQSGSVRRELIILRHVFEVAIREWAIPIGQNPCRQMRLPQDSRSRERRLLGNDERLLLAAIAPRTEWYMRPLLTLLVETGMRRGELLSICWRDVDLATRTIRILNTKNGHPRRIPLTPAAVSTLAALPRIGEEVRVFPLTPNAVRLTWERLRKRANLPNLRLHDLRHEAVSRFFEYGLSVPEVALISGHRELKMLSRYTHLQPERIADKLAQLSQSEVSHDA